MGRGASEEIVIDNGATFVIVLDWLERRFSQYLAIRISAYNLRANSIVELQHCTLQDSIVNACEGNVYKQPSIVPCAVWADQATTRKSTGHSLWCSSFWVRGHHSAPLQAQSTRPHQQNVKPLDIA